MKKVISTKPTVANITRITTLLTDTPVKLAVFREGLSDEQLCRPLGSGERSFTEDLAHLLNCEARSSEAIYLALLANEPVFVNIHPERQLGKLLQYERFSVSELLVYFTFRRTVLLRVLASLTEQQWSRTICEEGKKRQESVYWQARSLALHEFEHVSDIEHKLSELGMTCLAESDTAFVHTIKAQTMRKKSSRANSNELMSMATKGRDE